MNALSIAILFGTGGGLGSNFRGDYTSVNRLLWKFVLANMLGHHWRVVCIILSSWNMVREQIATQ